MADVSFYRPDSVSLVPNGNSQSNQRALENLLTDLRTPTEPENKPAVSHNSSPLASTIELRTPLDDLDDNLINETTADLRQTSRATNAMADDVISQMEELESHRRAVREMTGKILAFNEKRIELEKENADLRRQLDGFFYTAKPSIDVDDETKLEPDELKRRYVLVKGKYRRQAADLKEYKDKVVELQRKLIEKNELEKEYLSKANSSSNRFVDERHLQRQLDVKKDQIAKLDETIRNQQRLIEKYERIVNSRSSKDNQEQRIYDVLREENRMLRLQLENITAEQAAERRTAAIYRTSDAELSRLQADLLRNQQKLEVAQERIRSMEKQMEDDARRWSREKTELQLRLKESSHGLGWPSPFPYRRSPLPNLGTAAERDYIPRDYWMRNGSPQNTPINRPGRPKYPNTWH